MRKTCKIICGCVLGLFLALGSTVESIAADANAYNPYMQKKLPNLRQPTAEAKRFLQDIGAHETRLENEAAFRVDWKSEVYPVVFGNKTAPGEIVVLLNFAVPESEKIWQAVVEASRSLQEKNVKIVVFGNSSEYFGTDLMGFGIWVAASRPGQALNYFSYALHRWNEVKRKQKAVGINKLFSNEYDATLTSKDMPIHYAYMRRLKPVVPAEQELTVAKYSYDAGSVNMYQTTQLAKYYNVEKLPAVIVNGRKLDKVSSAAIIDALK